MTILQTRVKPNARGVALDQQTDGNWQARLKSLPIEGRANAELVAMLARHFALPQARVTIRSGASRRTL